MSPHASLPTMIVRGVSVYCRDVMEGYAGELDPAAGFEAAARAKAAAGFEAATAERAAAARTGEAATKPSATHTGQSAPAAAPPGAAAKTRIGPAEAAARVA